MKINIYILFHLLLLSHYSFSQSIELKTYYVEIPNRKNVPSVIINDNNVTLITDYPSLNEIFRSHNIKSFHEAFPGTKRELLLRTYLIVCEPDLIKILEKDYSDIFTRFEQEHEIQQLYIPNDIGINGGQPELEFINAIDAWDLADGSGVTIGIAEPINVLHEDLAGKSIYFGTPPGPTSIGHGTMVALVAGASTDNGTGMASVGFNCNIVAAPATYPSLLTLAQNGARVINMSWGPCNTNPIIYHNEVIDEVWNDYGVVLVAAAGNGQLSCPSGPQFNHFPASYNHVISVTNVGHQYKIGTADVSERLWKDVFLQPIGPYNATYNVNVDLSAPGRNIMTALTLDEYYYEGGTSFSAPQVTGTIGLMFDVNECLFPDEIETILKLTVVKNDTLTQNLPYQGLIGAGRLDVFKAVDMAKEMSDEFGTVKVVNRIIDRWDFVLRTNPYEIYMGNNIVSNTATIEFTARNNIEIQSGDYMPTTGFVDLKINPVNEICNTPVEMFSRTNSTLKNNTSLFTSKLYPNPNKGSFTIMSSKTDLKEITVSIFDVLGKSVYTTNATTSKFDISLPNLPAGMYFVKLSSGNYHETLKFIKD